MPGGLREVALTDHKMLDIYPRMGFLRLAWESDAHVIPVYAQGENRVFKTVTWFPKLRNFLISVIMYPFPTYVIGPRREKIRMIIGSPINPKDFNSIEEFYHQFYSEFATLVKKYDDQNTRYGKNLLQWIE